MDVKTELATVRRLAIENAHLRELLVRSEALLGCNEDAATDAIELAAEIRAELTLIKSDT